VGGDAGAIGPPKHVTRVAIAANYTTYFGAAGLPYTIAHELSHACRVFHHGGGNAYLIWGARQFPGLPSFLDDVTLYAAVQQGQNSGVEQCIMRYNWAHVIIGGEQGGVSPVRWYGPAEREYARYCDQRGATGVNAPPQSKCGDAGQASQGAGMCREQLCVSDLYY
jgi:hypothetical protein